MEKLTDILADVLLMLKDGMSLAADQIPTLIQDFISWGIVKESTHVIIWLVVIITLKIVANKFDKYSLTYRDIVEKLTAEEEKEGYYNRYGYLKEAREEATGFTIAKYVVYAALFFATLLLIGELMDVIKILVAPRIYLIEEITNLLKPAVK